MPDKLTIRSNHHLIPLLDWSDLTAKERAEFDFLDTDTKQSDASFARYKGEVYHLNEFTAILSRHQARNPGEVDRMGFPLEWHAYQSDSFFSGVVVRWATDDDNSVIMGTYCS